MGTGGRREEAKAYQRSRIILRLSGLCDAALILAILQFTGLSSRLGAAALGLCGGSFYPALCVYFLVFSAACTVFMLPLSFYGGFLLEHRFGLSNQSFSRWLSEEIKKTVLSFPFSLALVVAYYAIGRTAGAWWWVGAAGVAASFSVVFTMVFPFIVLPLFYRCVPLADGNLKGRVLALAGKFGIPVSGVFLIDFSKNTRKANAAVIGCGRTRRVILTDTLVNDFPPDEVEVVIAHEMAHYAYGHIWKLLTVHCLSTFVFFWCLGRLLPALALVCGAAGPFDPAILPAAALFLGLFEFAVAPARHAFSRALEREADLGSIEATGKREAFISLMRRLADKNLSDENPHTLIEILFYDHPPIGKRIRMAEQYAGQ